MADASCILMLAAWLESTELGLPCGPLSCFPQDWSAAGRKGWGSGLLYTKLHRATLSLQWGSWLLWYFFQLEIVFRKWQWLKQDKYISVPRKCSLRLGRLQLRWWLHDVTRTQVSSTFLFYHSQHVAFILKVKRWLLGLQLPYPVSK